LALWRREAGDIVSSIAFGLSFPLKSILRFFFPYTVFKGENRAHDFARLAMETIVFGALGNLLFVLMFSGVAPK
jgi:lipoprotein signal peptidase